MQRRFAIFTLTVLVALLFAADLAHGQSSRLYFAGYLGLNTFSESEFRESSTPASGDITFKHAVSMGGALGLRLTPQLRLEGEISYRKADMDEIDFNNAGSFELGGELKTWLYMANLYYDFDFSWRNVEPFVTAGLGIAHHEGDIDDVSGMAIDASDSSIGLAWQLGTGLKYRLNSDLALISDYRYVGTTDFDMRSYEFDYGAHEFRVGLEYDIPVGFLR